MVSTRDKNVPSEQLQAAAIPDGYWLNDLSGKGRAPFNTNPNGYKVFRNVKEYGARGIEKAKLYIY